MDESPLRARVADRRVHKGHALMGRPRKYKSNAEKQKAYRARKKGEREAQVQAEREKKFEAHQEAVVRPLQRRILFGNEAGDLSDFRGADPK